MPAAKSKKSAPPTVTTATEAPVVEKKSVKKVAKKTETPVVAVEPPAPVVAHEPVTDTHNQVVSSDNELSDGFTEFINKFQSILSQFSALKTDLKTLERKTTKQLKVVQKIQQKKKRKGTRAPSGFVKPAPISSELAKFLGQPEGAEMARTDVTREINKYIRAHSLQDPENGRKINPDKKLCDLLKIDDSVNLTYFNLQRYMGPHFPKQTKTETTTTA
jgi:chromatin remodeling complex protein RSC6